jgi:hypothetical protein
MPQFVMLVRVDPDVPVPEAGSDPEPWVDEGKRTAVWLQGSPVEDPDAATTVRVRNGETLVSDGPFAETKEYIAGYDLLEADDLEQAVDFASRHPVAAFGALEVREVWPNFVPDTGETSTPNESGVDYLLLHQPEPELLANFTWAEGNPAPWMHDVEQRGISLGGYRLQDAKPANSATVRKRGGETLVTRGPFAETAEQVAGINLVRVADLDEALALAAAHPTARIGAIDIRPLRDL